LGRRSRRGRHIVSRTEEGVANAVSALIILKSYITTGKAHSEWD
jgi:hypothetical protein